jgi:hypothetical protein
MTTQKTSTEVRQLAWTGVTSLDASAFGIETFYRITGTPGNWILISPGAREYVKTHGYGTQVLAKAAAQSDFERRVNAELALSR